MAISFTAAPVVNEGTDRPNSFHYNKLVDAYNDRIKSGIGDCAWRIAWQAFSATRLIRNPNGIAFPPVDELLKLYLYLDPSSGVTWPVASPGDPEGISVTSPLGTFVFGAAALNLDSEDERLHGIDGVPLWYSGAPPSSVSDHWNLGKLQRGLADSTLYDTSLNISAPALEAAQAHYAILPNRQSKKLLSYGSFAPTPEILGDCGDGTTDRPASPVWEIKLTSLKTPPDADKIYAGYCPAGSSGRTAHTPHLDGVIETPFSYYVYKVDGTLEKLSKNDWLLGPFTGSGELMHHGSDSLDIFMTKFALEFRGSDFEKADGDYRVLKKAFGNQPFFERQYVLAPGKGTWNPSTETIDQDDVLFTWNKGTIVSGTKGSFEGGGTSMSTSTGFVLAGFYASAPTIEGTTRVSLIQGGVALGTVTLSPSNPEEILYLEIAATGTIEFQIDDDLKTPAGAGDGLTVEIAELLEYKPFPSDLYLCLRSSSAQSAASTTPEPLGNDTITPKDFSDALFRYGCIVNRAESAGLQAQDEIVNNAIFESSRQFIKDSVRYAHRGMINNYEVTAEGKTVLYLDRYALSSDYDVFGDMIDAIRSDAPEKGFSNEWVCLMSWVPYTDSSSSTYDPSVYADILGHLNNPAHLYSGELETADTIRAKRHFVIGVDEDSSYVKNVQVAEAPPGYSYIKGTNDPAGHYNPWGHTSDELKEKYYSAHQIYEAPYEIESVEDAGSDVVKITFKTRIQHHPDAPETVDKDDSTWVAATIASEDYATDENRLRKYIRKSKHGDDFDYQLGDTSTSGYLLRNNYAQKGTIYPRIHFVKLLPKAYEDGNLRSGPLDTKCYSDPFLKMAWYSRAMCEGFVDNVASTDCLSQDVSGTPVLQVESMYDYTLENALLQANGNRSFEIIPELVRDLDHANGFGPLPGLTPMYADQFNQFSRFINLLTRARLELPLELEYKIHTVRGKIPITPVNSYSPASCSPDGDQSSFGGFALWQGTPPREGAFASVTDWEPFDALVGDSVSFEFRIANYTECVNGDARLMAEGDEQYFEWRFQPDQKAFNAIPIAWRDMLNLTAGIWFEYSWKKTEYPRYTAPGSGPSIDGDPIASWPGTGDLATIEIDETFTQGSECRFYTVGGTLKAQDISDQVMYRFESGGAQTLTPRSEVGLVPVNGVAGNGNLFVTIPITP